MIGQILFKTMLDALQIVKYQLIIEFLKELAILM